MRNLTLINDKFNTQVHDFGKFKMLLDKNDKDVSEQIRLFGWYKDELITTKVFERYLKDGMSVLDLGANIGFYTMLARSLVGPKGRVFAFEPHPHNSNLIKASVKLNSFTNVKVVEAAISDRVGKSTLFVSQDYISEHSLFDYNYSSGPHNGKNNIAVNVVTIDDYLEKNLGNFKVDFIKMDIEGSESRALKGMKKVLNENKHLILVMEFWPEGFKNDKVDPRKILEKLKKLKFRISHIDEFEQRIYPVSIDKIMEIAEFRIKNQVERNKITKYGDWYTNLLCVK